MASSPAFAVYPEVGHGLLSIANTNRDGVTGSGYVVFCTGANNGTRIAEIVTQAVGTTTAGMVRVYISGVGITNSPLFDEISIAAATPAANTKATRVSTTYNNLVLMSGQFLRATTHNAESINIFALGADL